MTSIIILFRRCFFCLVSFMLALMWLILTFGLIQGAAGNLIRITHTPPQTGDILSTRKNLFPSLSGNSQKIAFISDVDFFNHGVITRQYEIWLYDTTTLSLTRVTSSSTGSASWITDLTDDGTKLVFDLGQTGINANLWLYDANGMSLTQLTTASHNNRSSSIPSISGDGGKIAFVSDSDFLGQGLPDDQNEIWLYDTTTLAVTRITTASAANRDSGYSNISGLSLSGDGSKIAFVSDSDFLGQGLPDDQFEIWLYDTATLTVTRITTASDSGRDSHFPVLNADGSKVAFMSNSDLLGQGIPIEQAEIWLYDTSVMTLTRITTALGGSTPASEGPSLSADGETIAFHSYADLLGQGLPGTYSEIWLYRSSVHTTTRLFYFPMIFKRKGLTSS